jgi:hypothetical protein
LRFSPQQVYIDERWLSVMIWAAIGISEIKYTYNLLNVRLKGDRSALAKNGRLVLPRWTRLCRVRD